MTKDFNDKCPTCSSEDIELIDSGLEMSCGNSYYYQYECKECGEQFTVWYDLTFSEVRID